MLDPKNSEWFQEWFNSPYYHILYKNRNNIEAQNFMDHLIATLAIPENAQILDVACGRGRHSIYLNQKGYEVCGIDLSSENIKAAKNHEREGLQFFQHDMREPFKKEAFDYAFNLFTSFGYFETENEEQAAINAIAHSLKHNGIFVLDFLNPYKVINNLVEEEHKELEGISFQINRSFDGSHIIKNIEFKDGDKSFQFQEKVKAIRKLSFLDYFRNANLMLLQLCGDYELNDYQPESSDRMIFITRKL